MCAVISSVSGKLLSDLAPGFSSGILDRTLFSMAREKATLRIVDQGIRGYGQACHYDGEALSIKLLGKPDAVMIVPRSSIAILTDLAINRRHMLFAKYPYRYNLRLRSDSFLIS